MGFGGEDTGARGFRVLGLGVRTQGLEGLGFGGEDTGARGFRVWGLGVRTQGLEARGGREPGLCSGLAPFESPVGVGGWARV